MKYVNIDILNVIRKEDIDLFNKIISHSKRYARIIIPDVHYVSIESISFYKTSIYLDVLCRMGFSDTNGTSIRYHIVGNDNGRTDQLYESMIPWLLHYNRDKKLEEIGI